MAQVHGLQDLLVYRALLDDPLFTSVAARMDAGTIAAGGAAAHGDAAQVIAQCSDAVSYESAGTRYGPAEVCGGLIDAACRYGFYGDLWADYVADLLVNVASPYAAASELRGGQDPSSGLAEAALLDMTVLCRYLHGDYEKAFGAYADLISSFKADPAANPGHVYNLRIRDRICELAMELKSAGDPAQMLAYLSDFYKQYGTGDYGLHKCFRVRVQDGHARIEPILNISHVYLTDIVGYEDAKKRLVDNTEAFVSGRPCANVLLYGDAGTGKSSSIKGIANEFYDRGLRVVEIYKHQFEYLNDVIDLVKSRNYKFIIYMDDLSFEDTETQYKYLKAVIEGGLERKPDNILIYATSNRRHLLRESAGDRQDDLHPTDAMAEKLSLAARFGVAIRYTSPDREQYEQIVLALADRAGLTLDEDELLAFAGQFELTHGGRSGRTARQCVDYLAGRALL